MAHPANAQRRQKLPVSSPDARVDARGGGDDSSALPCSLPLAFLTINSVSTLYRASVNGDTPVVVFVLAVYLAYLVLDYCITELGRPDGGPRRRAALKVVAWILATAIGFGFAYHFSQLVSLGMAVAFHAMAATSSAVLFYTYFYCDRGDRRRGRWCRVEEVEVEFVYGGAKKASADAKNAGDLSDAAENV
ncbi:hypothetical protein BT93_I1001 [Corymbia citriodora subsp. variegata]|nr:hypothetical protein BT93_I1001 [Corymbia citriodora subsp. variegata]